MINCVANYIQNINLDQQMIKKLTLLNNVIFQIHLTLLKTQLLYYLKLKLVSINQLYEIE